MPEPLVSTATSRQGGQAKAGAARPAEAVAYFAQCIALLLFAGIVAGAGSAIAAASGGRESWSLFVGGIGGLILLLLAIYAYMQGSRALNGKG